MGATESPNLMNDALRYLTFDLSSLDEPPIPGSQGAMQLTFRKLGFDYYPFHRPGECVWGQLLIFLPCPVSFISA